MPYDPPRARGATALKRSASGGVGYFKIFCRFASKNFSRADENQAVGNLPPFSNHKIMVESGGLSY